MPAPVALPEDTLVSHVIFPSWQRLNEESSQVRHRARSRVLRAFLPSTSATSRKHLHRRIRARTRLSSTPLPRCSLFSFIYQRETFESRNLGIPTSLLSSPLHLRTSREQNCPTVSLTAARVISSLFRRDPLFRRSKSKGNRRG